MCYFCPRLIFKSPAYLSIAYNYKWLFSSLCCFQHFCAKRCYQGWEEHDLQLVVFPTLNFSRILRGSQNFTKRRKRYYEPIKLAKNFK